VWFSVALAIFCSAFGWVRLAPRLPAIGNGITASQLDQADLNAHIWNHVSGDDLQSLYLYRLINAMTKLEAKSLLNEIGVLKDIERKSDLQEINRRLILHRRAYV